MKNRQNRLDTRTYRSLTHQQSQQVKGGNTKPVPKAIVRVADCEDEGR
ncbi:MAG: hypothetical protein AAFV95_14240 [Bacteroidota bacterium]